MDAVSRFDLLTDYELAASFHELATERCTSWAEADRREKLLDEVAVAMDARGVRLEDWDLSYRY